MFLFYIRVVTHGAFDPQCEHSQQEREGMTLDFGSIASELPLWQGKYRIDLLGWGRVGENIPSFSTDFYSP